jgi:antitoxin YefM
VDDDVLVIEISRRAHRHGQSRSLMDEHADRRASLLTILRLRLMERQSGTIFWYEGVMMMAMSASEARKRLFPLIEQVNEDQEPVEIVSKAGTAYLVSADQWRSLMETAHLLRSPVNAERLLRSIADAEAGRIEVQELLDPQHDVT